jgi:electron transfer flavoprotein beta subunit
MNIVVCVKYVPDATSDRTFNESDNTTDRLGVDGLLSELDEYAIEAALKLVESAAGSEGAEADPAHSSTVTVLTVGPDKAADAIKKIGNPDLILTGMASTDGTMGVVPAMLAERLGLPQATLASELTVEDGTATIRRDGDVASETITASLPALVSVTDQINEPRYPSFKGIMAAKKKPVETWSLADLGIDVGSVGLAAAWTTVESFARRPPRVHGQVVTDEGDGGTKLAEFLSAQKLI